MLGVGVMISSGIFIVFAETAREIGSPGYSHHLLIFRPATTWAGFVIVLAGLPVYWLIRRTKTDSSVLAAPDAAES
jgi:hypothetical protein